MVKTLEMQCVTALNKLKRKIPYSWDLNIYRGCEHGCSYCYAMYSHNYLDKGDFFQEIYVKTNIVEYKNKLYKMVNSLRDKYALPSSYTAPLKKS